MTQLNPYLTFTGNCEEAINFYKECLDGDIVSMNYFENSPMEVPENYKKKIMHVTLQFEGGNLMASDGMPEDKLISGNNISLSIALDDLDKTDKYFNKLSEGGKITMPLQGTFWGARFGMLTDKFGIHWMVNCELKK